jgi:hypothetical protein
MATHSNTGTSRVLATTFRHASFLACLTTLTLLLAACGSGASRAQATPPTATGSTSLSALKAELGAEAARLKAVDATIQAQEGALGAPSAGPVRTWSKPGVYRWTVPANAGMVEIVADGGSGGGGNAGWIRAPGDGLAYTCVYEHACFGAGGGGGGASAVAAGGTLLVVAPGGGGGGAGVRHHGGGGGGAPGGGGAELAPRFFTVVPNRGAWTSCRTRCVYRGEVLTITVGAGGGGASGGSPGEGGEGYGGPGGTGGARCGGVGGSGGRYGGGGGGGAACHWNLPGGAGGSGAYGGGGGAGAQGETSCNNHGGSGGGFVGEGAPPKTWRHAYGESGRCGGGKGGLALAPAPVWMGAGILRAGRGSETTSNAQAGMNGRVEIVVGTHGS